MMAQSFHLGRALPVFAFGAVLLLGGCGDSGLARSFGLVRDAPDEFSVTTQPPLSMPPNFQLRAPEPGAPRPQAPGAAASAEAVLAPGSVTANAGMSPGQQALVQEAGPPAPANIRRKVDRDAALADTGPSFTDQLMFWRTPPKPGIVVDPARERQRLQTNAALGLKEDTGETPIIQPRAKSFFQSLF